MFSPEVHTPNIPEILQCLRIKDADVQANALAFLQHLTYQNEASKEAIRHHNGIPMVISLLKSSSSACQLNAAGVLRNLSYGPNMQTKKQIESCGMIETIESYVHNVGRLDRRLIETLMAIVCNLSCLSTFQPALSNILLTKIIHGILIPFIGLRIDPSANRILSIKISELTISFCPLLDYVTTFLKNMSGGPKSIRQQMRICEGLVDSIVAIIQYGSHSHTFNGKIVENSICIIQNLCYALEDVYDRKPSNNLGDERKEPSCIEDTKFSNHRQLEIGGNLILRSPEMIDLLLEIISYCKNYSSVAAAIGTVQNLSACKWDLSQEFRINFRKHKGLPSLVQHIISGPDQIVNVTLTALRNLTDDSRNLELISDHGLPHLIQCLPSSGLLIVKRTVITDSGSTEQCLSLDTIYKVLSFIYFLLRKREQLCQVFVKRSGVKKCMFLLKSDAFYRENISNSHGQHSGNAERLPILSGAILQFLWTKPQLKSYFRQEKWTCEDFCVQSLMQRMKASIMCDKDSQGFPIYYGKPYVKARLNNLLPAPHQMGQVPAIRVSPDGMADGDPCSLLRNPGLKQYAEHSTDLDNLQSTPSGQKSQTYLQRKI